MLMEFLQNVSLAKYSTMRLGGVARFAVEIHDRNELLVAVNWAKTNKIPVIMVGEGSNIVWSDEGFPGLLLINRIKKFEPFLEDQENYYLNVGAGEDWDEVVGRTVEAGATGIEALSGIPGTAGATPIQNVGAYGQEISQSLVSVEALDLTTNQYLTIPNSDCAFAYRTSRFKTTDKNRFLITGLTLHLMIGNPRPPFYPAVQTYLANNNIKELTPKTIREAVLQIRGAKLPDPLKVPNNGSFFANPIIDQDFFSQLLDAHPGIIYWPADSNQVKISAAWLVEQAGFKAFHDQETGMATWENQSLVFVNEHAKKTADLLKFKQKVVSKVEQTFGIHLEQEPIMLP